VEFRRRRRAYKTEKSRVLQFYYSLYAGRSVSLFFNCPFVAAVVANPTVRFLKLIYYVPSVSQQPRTVGTDYQRPNPRPYSAFIVR
jgi:hypothetical protein